MIVAPDSPKVLAVLDWELSTLGDPLADFSYHLMQWHMPPSEAGTGSLVGFDLVALGIPASRISTISYGKERPAVLGSTEEAYAQNRRAVTVVN